MMKKSCSLLLAMALGLGSSMAYAQSLDVKLEPVKASFGENSDVRINVTYTNTGDDAINVLRWYVASEKLANNMFAITVNDHAVRYIGPIVKRPTPSAKDYLSLAAGQTLTKTIDLSDYYDISERGTYSVKVDVNAVNLYLSDKHAKTKANVKTTEQLTSDDVTFWAEGKNPKISMLGESKIVTPMAKSGLTFAGSCSATQQTQLSQAVSAAQTMVYDTYYYLLDNYSYSAASNSERYRTWFGQYDDQRFSTVTTHFYNIANALLYENVTADCSCDSDYQTAYAYVYPNQPYHIHLCGAFWPAPTSGTDSKAGTLIHEMSHFTVNGGTQDIAYGQYNARQLAASSPQQAVQNADSHEYFAENNPALN